MCKSVAFSENSVFKSLISIETREADKSQIWTNVCPFYDRVLKLAVVGCIKKFQNLATHLKFICICALCKSVAFSANT